MKTAEYLNLLKEQKGLKSNYAAAKYLGLTQAALSNYSRGKGYFSDEVAVRVADELGIPEGIVLADIHAEREHDPKLAKVWEQIAQQLKSVAACCFLVIFSNMPMDNAQAAGKMHAENSTDNLYIMRIFAAIRKRLKKALARVYPRSGRIVFC